MENDVLHCSRNGAKVDVKSCKRSHISDIVSKLLTGQGLINGWEELFLLHLLYSANDELCQEWQCLKNSLHFLFSFSSLRVCVHLGLFCFKTLSRFYKLKCWDLTLTHHNRSEKPAAPGVGCWVVWDLDEKPLQLTRSLFRRLTQSKWSLGGLESEFHLFMIP